MNRPEPGGDGAHALSMSKARDEPTLHDGEDGALSLHRSVGRWIQDASHLAVALGTDTQEGPTSGRPDSVRRFLDRNIEGDGVDDAESLKLHPHPIDTRTWKGQVEPKRPARVARVSVFQNGMLVHHVDQVGARRQQMTPRAEI